MRMHGFNPVTVESKMRGSLRNGSEHRNLGSVYQVHQETGQL